MSEVVRASLFILFTFPTLVKYEIGAAFVSGYNNVQGFEVGYRVEIVSFRMRTPEKGKSLD